VEEIEGELMVASTLHAYAKIATTKYVIAIDAAER
jgi:hypothetical protein